MQLRRLDRSDAAEVARLSGQLGYPASPDAAGAQLAALLERPSEACLGAEDGGVLVGWIHVQRRLVLGSEPFVEICALVVDEARRGVGIGQRLIEAAETWAERQGHRGVCIRSSVVRARTHRLYLRLGYALVKTQHVFVKGLTRAP